MARDTKDSGLSFLLTKIGNSDTLILWDSITVVQPGPKQMRTRTAVRGVLFSVVASPLLATLVSAHVGGLSGTMTAGTVPTWLTIVTGGVVVGASFLFTSLMTDHAAIRTVNGWRVLVPTPTVLRAAVRWTVRGLSIGILVLVIFTGFTGPQTPISNFAILAVWAGWWAGYTMTVYLVGNTWPLLNPWRALVELLPTRRYRSYPDWAGAWPSVIGLLGLVWLEVVSPVAEDSELLAVVVFCYSLVTLVGATVYGPETWFERVDPVSRVFRCYGRIAPFQRTTDGFEFTLPSTALTDRPAAETTDETAFIIALLWATTYDGFVSTPLWTQLARPIVNAGVPPLFLYFIIIVTGFGVFFAIYRHAASRARQTGRTYVAPRFIEGWFAPSLLPIAAGYHIAHFLSYFLTLAPALLTVASHPFVPPLPENIQLLVIPGWFTNLQIVFVLLGHLFAIWVAHALAFELFPGKLKPLRSQYPFIVVMIFYTMTSLWVVTQPFSSPPYV